MVDAVLSRGSTSVTIPLLEEEGNLLVARDVGKPTLNVNDVGREDPRTQDNMNAGDAFTFTGLLAGASAFSDAKTLAEDLIKPRATTGTPLQLDLSALPNRGTYDVAPTTQSACQLTYSAGEVNMVAVQCTLNVVSNTIGGDQTSRSTLSPDSGTGIKLDRGGTSVAMTNDLTVVRNVGRPNAELRPIPGDLPWLMDTRDPAVDEFEISGTFLNSAESNSNTLEEDIVRARLGQSSLRLHFLGNEYGLDAYDVVPTGSQAVRTLFRSSETGVVPVPTMKLRVVDNT